MTRPASSSATSPCCCPPTDSARTSSSPPAPSIADRRACHHASGSTSVPSGWGAVPWRTTSRVSASTTTTLQDWVEESTPATVLIPGLSADQVLDGELLEPDEAEVPLRRHLGIEPVVGLAERLQRLAVLDGRRRQVEDAGVVQCLDDPRVGPERLRLLLEHEIGRHVGLRRLPHAVEVLGPRGLVVEVPRTVVGRTTRREAVL